MWSNDTDYMKFYLKGNKIMISSELNLSDTLDLGEEKNPINIVKKMDLMVSELVYVSNEVKYYNNLRENINKKLEQTKE